MRTEQTVEIAAPADALFALTQDYGRRLEWDAANLRCPNAREAQAFIRRQYRNGWEL